jgi:hypothetical protein
MLSAIRGFDCTRSGAACVREKRRQRRDSPAADRPRRAQRHVITATRPHLKQTPACARICVPLRPWHHCSVASHATMSSTSRGRDRLST